MAAEHQPIDRHGITSTSDQPLVGVIVDEDGRQVARYFAADQPTPGTDDTLHAARAVIGAWAGLEDRDGVIDELDRLRHETAPAPPSVL